MNFTDVAVISAENYIKATLPAFDERERIRLSWDFKQWITFWNRGYWNSKQRVGAIMQAASQLDINDTYDDWVDVYTRECKTFEQIMQQVDELATAAQLPVSTALTYWWIHIIDNSFIGRKNELLVRAECEKKIQDKGLGVTLRESTDYEDRNHGVDLVAETPDGVVVFGIQIKGEAYFYSTRPTVVEAREQVHPVNYGRFYNAHNGARVWYAIIEEVLSGNEWSLKEVKYIGIQ